MNHSMSGKRVLVVYAHPEPKSMTGSIKNSIVKSLEDAGALVTVSDLYAMRFDPVIRPKDFPDKDPNHFFAGPECRKAALKGEYAKEAKDELDKLISAEFIITVSPLWWGTVPAIMKGWFDRVLVDGVVWDYGKRFETGICLGKRALNVFVVGGPEELYHKVKVKQYSKNAQQGQELSDRVHHITFNTFAYCGYDVVNYKHYHNVGQKTDEERKAMLKDAADYVAKLYAQPIMHKMNTQQQ